MAIRFVHAGDLSRPNDLISGAPLFPYAKPGLLPDVPTVQDILQARRLRDRYEPQIWQHWADAAGWDGPPLDTQISRLRAPLAVEATCAGYGVYLSSAECVNAHCQRGTLKRLSDVSLTDGAFRLLLQEGSARRKPIRIVREWLLDLTAKFRDTPFWEVDQPFG